MSRDRPNIREILLDAAVGFVQSAARLAAVRRIAVIGSIMTERPRPKDIDLLVYVANDADLGPLATLARRLIGRLQSQCSGADVFLADEDGHYLGRTCLWKVCRPGVRASCDALHCGRRPYLHNDLNTVRLDDAVITAPPLDIGPLVVRRSQIPADVERFVARLGEPHNYALQRSHSRVTPLAGQASRHTARR